MVLRRALRKTCLLLRDRRGATAIEYGLIVALIVIAMVVALKSVANANTDMWGSVSNKVQTAG